MEGILSHKELLNEIKQVSIANDVANYKEPLSAEEVCTIIAQDFFVSVKDIKGLSRKRECVLPRHLSMMFTKKYVFVTLKQVGNYFNRDHSTVINALRRVEWDAEFDKKLSDRISYYDKLFAKLKNQ